MISFAFSELKWKTDLRCRAEQCSVKVAFNLCDGGNHVSSSHPNETFSLHVSGGRAQAPDLTWEFPKHCSLGELTRSPGTWSQLWNYSQGSSWIRQTTVQKRFSQDPVPQAGVLSLSLPGLSSTGRFSTQHSSVLPPPSVTQCSYAL